MGICRECSCSVYIPISHKQAHNSKREAKGQVCTHLRLLCGLLLLYACLYQYWNDNGAGTGNWDTIAIAKLWRLLSMEFYNTAFHLYKTGHGEMEILKKAIAYKQLP